MKTKFSPTEISLMCHLDAVRLIKNGEITYDPKEFSYHIDDYMGVDLLTLLDIVREAIPVNGCTQEHAEVLYWCTYGFNHIRIGLFKDALEMLEKESMPVILERAMCQDTIYKKPSIRFLECYELWKGKIKRDDKYMLPNDSKLLPIAQIEAKRLLASGSIGKATELTQHIYEKYSMIAKCIHKVKPYTSFWEMHSKFQPNHEELIQYMAFLYDGFNREYMHNNDVFPIDLDDMSYITDFCKFYEKEIAPYQMLYSDTESKGSPNEHGQLDRLETEREKKYYQRAIEAGYAEEIDSGFLWLKPVGQLGYFISIVYKLYNQKPMSRLNALWWYKVNGTNSIEKVKSLSASISKAPQKHGDNRDDVQQWIDKMEKEVFFD